MTHRWLAVCALLTLSGATRAEPICEQPAHHAGEVRGGATLVHRFTLVNPGKEVVVFGEPKATCGCLRPVLQRRGLASGESCQVAVEINTVTQPAGDHTWQVKVPYREGKERTGELTLQVKGKIAPDLTIHPAALIIHTDTDVSHALTLTEHREEPIRIRSAVTTLEQVKAHVSDPIRNGTSWYRMIALQVTEQCPVGRHECVLHLHTEDSAAPELKMPFTVVKHPAGAVRPSPEAAEWRAARGEALPSKIVLLTGGENHPVVVEKVETSHACLKCTFATGPGPRSTLRIVCDEPPVGGFEGSVRVHLSKPTVQVVTVPVRVLVP